MPDVFVSYCHKDQITARRFAEGLEREGFDVWWDVAINPGEILDKVREQALGSVATPRNTAPIMQVARAKHRRTNCADDMD